MKILILNDETIETYIGGAALVNNKIKTELERNGHEVNYFIINNDSKTHDIQIKWQEYDYYILANIGYFSAEILKWVIKSKPFITFRHDIPTILYSTPPSIFYKEFMTIWQDMFKNAKLSVFISPMQEAVFKAHFEVLNSKVLIPPLDVSSFKNEAKKDRNGALYIGDISPARGCVKTLDIMKKHQPDSRYLFIGKIIDQKLADYLKSNGAEVLDAIPHKEVATYMNDYEYLFYFPEIYDSFCLKILEADLCGMKIIADTERIGIFSYKTDTQKLIYNMEHNSISHIIDTINNSK